MDNLNTKKIIFCGSDAISLPMLEYLSQLSVISICGVLSQPDRRSGRGRELKANPVKEWAIQKDLEVRSPVRPSRTEIDWIKERAADMVLVMAYGHILSDEFLNSIPLGCYNLHASLLPAYRGASPIETALANGDKKTGVTLMRMVRKMDAGPIVGQKSVEITEEDTGATLRFKLGDVCVPLVDQYLEALMLGSAEETFQNESKITYCRKLNKDDSILDFSLDARLLECRVRAFKAWPGSVIFYEGTALRVGSCVARPDQGLAPGELNVENELFIGTGRGTLQVLELQKPGGKMLAVSDFLRGYTLKNGSHLDFSISIPLVSKKF